MPIFNDVLYYLSQSLPPQRQQSLSTLLLANGAVQASLPKATHVITNTRRFEGWQGVGQNVAVVTERWVERSMVLGKMQPTQYYSADPQMLFSGVVACATDLPTADLEVLSAGITALGGLFRMGLTRDVTHLFALTSSSAKYETAMHFREHTNIKVLLPHWFDDAVRLGYGDLDTAVYEWPNPRVLEPDMGISLLETDRARDKDRDPDKEREKKALFKGLHWSPPGKDKGGVERDVWEGRKILLGDSLQLIEGRRQAVEAGIQRAGGVVVTGDVEGADVLITRHRAGKVYLKALRLRKTIGTLAWLYYVESTGAFSVPTDQLLHYPIHRHPIEGFSSHIISVTNYTGQSRDYLKKLITAMGAEFTPSMSGKNTVLIAAYIAGTKATKARTWSIPIVNHTWLEDCFTQWRKLTVALEKYVVFPPGMDFSTVLGVKGVTDVEKDLELPESDEDDERTQLQLPEQSHRTNNQSPIKGKQRALEPTGTQSSSKDAVEVVDLIANGEELLASDEEDEEDPPTSTKRRGRPPKSVSAKRVSALSTSPAKLIRSTRVPAGPKASTRGGNNHSDEGSDDSDGNGEDGRRLKDILKAATKPKSKPTPIAKRTLAKARPLPFDDESEPVAAPKFSPLKSKGKRLESDSDEEPPRVLRSSPSKARITATQKEKTKTNSNFESSTIDITSDEESPVPKANPPRQARPTTPDLKGYMETDTDTDLPVDVRTVITPSKGKGRETASPDKNRTPRRVMSVLIPPPPYRVSPTKSSSTPSRRGLDLERMESVRAMAGEAGAGSPSKSRPKPAPPSENKSDTRESSFGPLVRTPSKRSAATRATLKLRDEVMPDMMNFEHEMKRARGKGVDFAHDMGKKSSKSQSVDESEELEELRPVKKRKASDRPSKMDSESESIVETRPPKRNRGDRLKQAADASDVDSAGEGGAAAKVRARSSSTRKPSASKPVTKEIRLMTTGFSLADDVIKALVKLGVKLTTKPSDCTHLLVPRMLRTEKFLCALAVAPYILTDKWALNSAAMNELQPEDSYALIDPESEGKYKFKLSKSLELAKRNNGRFFTKKVFYVTPKVPVDMKLLRNVITAFGGQCSTQHCTDRILKNNPDRHLISCPADERTWKPLAGDHPIYTQELILTGVLRQRIDWEDTAFQVPGSF